MAGRIGGVRITKGARREKASESRKETFANNAAAWQLCLLHFLCNFCKLTHRHANVLAAGTFHSSES
jgi:hypothetical protein